MFDVEFLMLDGAIFLNKLNDWYNIQLNIKNQAFNIKLLCNQMGNLSFFHSFFVFLAKCPIFVEYKRISL